MEEIRNSHIIKVVFRHPPSLSGIVGFVSKFVGSSVSAFLLQPPKWRQVELVDPRISKRYNS